MTTKTLDRANHLLARIKLARQRIENLRKLRDSEKLLSENDFYIHYRIDNTNYCITEEDDICDIITALIRYEAEVRDKCQKEFEEL